MIWSSCILYIYIIYNIIYIYTCLKILYTLHKLHINWIGCACLYIWRILLYMKVHTLWIYPPIARIQHLSHVRTPLVSFRPALNWRMRISGLVCWKNFKSNNDLKLIYVVWTGTSFPRFQEVRSQSWFQSKLTWRMHDSCRCVHLMRIDSTSISRMSHHLFQNASTHRL